MDITLKLSMQDLQIVMNGLAELPGRMCIPVINLINKQLSEQQPLESNGSSS